MPIDKKAPSPTRVVVHAPCSYFIRFRDDVAVPLGEPHLQQFLHAGNPGWARFAEKIPGARLRPLFPGSDPAQLKKLYGPFSTEDRGPARVHLLQTLILDVPEKIPYETVRAAAAHWPEVHSLWPFLNVVNPAWPPASTSHPAEPGFAVFPGQHYASAAPTGINALWARQQQGGRGAGQHLYDIEVSWDITHPQLADAAGAPRPTILHPVPPAALHNPRDQFEVHGTGTLGIICANDDGTDLTGLAPATPLIHLYGNERMVDVIIQHIKTITADTVPGKNPVLLLEIQYEDAAGNNWPIEIIPAIKEAIQVAVLAGITVIVPAGNSPTHLDEVIDDFSNSFHPNPNQPLDPIQPFLPGGTGYYDSGSIYVAAGVWDDTLTGYTRWSRWSDSAYGQRINCFAQGEGTITLLAGDPTRPATGYNATSAASAIIAGAALCVQGMAIYRGTAYPFYPRLDPLTLRKYLSNTTTPLAYLAGNTRTHPSGASGIGVMPNLRYIGNRWLDIPMKPKPKRGFRPWRMCRRPPHPHPPGPK